tara:strand:- start:897 stop:1802 length:906 start_codon:yes stop_codon:yes gene_type:complete
VQDKFKSIDGIVVAIKANYFIVDINTYNDNKINIENSRFLCTLRKKIVFKGQQICVGDFVGIEAADWKYMRAVISSVKPRGNFLSRPAVANLTQVIVVLSLRDPLLDLDQASRFILTAELTYSNVFVVLSKSDLFDITMQNHVRKIYQWGYSPIQVSIKTGDGIETLLSKIESTRLSVICGPSGVGKTSLLNYILPDKELSTSEVSGKLRRGRHTTRHVELYSLHNKSLVADTPGFNRPDIQTNPSLLSDLFPEIREQRSKVKCRFRDCLHLDEPGCLINKNWFRYQQYKEMLRDMLSLQD